MIHDNTVSFQAETEALDRLGAGFRSSARHHLRLWLIRRARRRCADLEDLVERLGEAPERGES